MTSLTKISTPQQNSFRVKTRTDAKSFDLLNISLPGLAPELRARKPRAIRLFRRENPRKRPDAKVLIQMRKSTHTWLYIFSPIFSYFVSTGSFKIWFSMKSQFL